MGSGESCRRPVSAEMSSQVFYSRERVATKCDVTAVNWMISVMSHVYTYPSVTSDFARVHVSTWLLRQTLNRSDLRHPLPSVHRPSSLIALSARQLQLLRTAVAMGVPNIPACGRRPKSAAPLHLIASTVDAPGLSTLTLTATRTFQVSLLSGAAAGFTVDAFLFPLDTLKTRMQLAATSPATSVKATPLLKGLYAGFAPAVAASAPAAAAFFAMYDYTKRVLSARVEPKYTPLCHMAAAAAGDIASSTVRVPFEVVKQRMQSGMYTSARAAVRGTLAKEGVAGFFSGYGSLVLRELPFDAMQFPLYEYLKAQWARRAGVEQLETWQSSLCGSLAGGVSAAVTTPLDVVKTRLMTQGAGVGKYKGIVHGLRTIAREEGAAALMSGVAPRVMWISIGGAVFFGAYEAAKKVLFPTFAKRQLEEEQQRKIQ